MANKINRNTQSKEDLQYGDQVYWNSTCSRKISEHFYSNVHKGVFLGWIDANVEPVDVAPLEYLEATPRQQQSDKRKGKDISRNYRALVRVNKKDSQGRKIAPYYYKPIANRVHKIQPLVS